MDPGNLILRQLTCLLRRTFYYRIGLRYIPPGLTFRNVTFSPHSAFMWISGKKQRLTDWLFGHFRKFAKGDC